MPRPMMAIAGDFILSPQLDLSGYKCELFDNQGRRVRHQSISAGKQLEMDTTGLPIGDYEIRFTDPAGKVRRNKLLLIQHRRH